MESEEILQGFRGLNLIVALKTKDREDCQGLHILPSRYRLCAGNAGASASFAYRASNHSSVCTPRSYLAAMLLLYLPPYQSFVPGQQVDYAASFLLLSAFLGEQ